MAKPTRHDVNKLGLPSPAAATPRLRVERVDQATGLLFSRAHGFEEGDVVTLRLLSSTTTGAAPTSLPAPLAEGTPYEVVPSASDAYRLRPVGGATITSFSTAGAGQIGVCSDPFDGMDAAIDEAHAYVQEALTGHGGEVDAAVVFAATKTLAVVIYVAKTCANDPAKANSYKPITDLWGQLYEPLVTRWRRGVPVRTGRDETPDVVENGAVLVNIGARGAFDFGDGGMRA